jgi:hypothetical protein
MLTLKKLSVVTFLFSGIFSINSNAQIVYTDLNPDYTGSSFLLDINNDGIGDFRITAWNSHDASGYYSFVTAGAFSSGNGVAVNQNPANAITNYAKNFSSGAIIDASAFWLLEGTSEGILKNKYSYCASVGGCHHGGGGDFNAKEGYLGLRLNVNGQTYYGWARIKKITVSNTSASYVLEDYAYESTPNVAIIAGDTRSTTTVKSSNNKEIENTGSNKLKLNVAPNPVSATAKISFTLSNSTKVSLKIYDIIGRLTKVLAEKEFAEGEHQIVWDVSDVRAGIYLLRMESVGYSKTQKLILIK